MVCFKTGDDEKNECGIKIEGGRQYTVCRWKAIWLTPFKSGQNHSRLQSQMENHLLYSFFLIAGQKWQSIMIYQLEKNFRGNVLMFVHVIHLHLGWINECIYSRIDA